MGRDVSQRPPLGKRVGDVERIQGEHGRLIRELRDTLQIKDNSAAEVKDWIGRRVSIQGVREGSLYVGVLKWVDKYNYAILEDGAPAPTIIQKGNVEAISLCKE
jgi:hypothetical protein